eukprot:431845-Ditylum_brightwellii.AAC.1
MNAHAKDWDSKSNKDRIDIRDYTDENGINIFNNALPTYHTSKEGTTSDITLFESETAMVEEWQRQPLLGKCHHDVTQYLINLEEVIDPLKERERKTPKKTKNFLEKSQLGRIQQGSRMPT